jgi:hypothetical protein
VTGRLVFGLLVAIASALALNWGFFAQHAAASRLSPLSLRHPVRSLRLLVSTPRWLAGYTAGMVGWGLYLVALALAPLSLVQAASAGGVGFLALLAWKLGGVSLTRREAAGVGLALVGLLLLGLSLVGGSTAGSRAPVMAVAAWIGGSVVAAAAAAGPARAHLAQGAGFGIAAGIMYAAGDVATKAAIAGQAWPVLVPVLLLCHGLGFVALQTGFQSGGALASAGNASLAGNALPIAAGVALFRDPFPGGPLSVVRGAAFAGLIAGATMLARPSAPDGSEATQGTSDGTARGVWRPGRRSAGPLGGSSRAGQGSNRASKG